MNLLGRKLRSFLRQPLFLQAWFLPVWILLGFCKTAILLYSFRRLAPLLGEAVGTSAWVPLLTRGEEARALQIGRVVRLAARYTPWDSNCFPQAVAARVLLGLYRIPHALYFGLMRDLDSTSMQAHAWVAAGRTRVTGGFGFDRYTVVGCFVSPGWV